MRVTWKGIRRVWITFGVLAWIATPLYGWLAFRPTGFGADILRSDARVRVGDGADSLSFAPVAASAGSGLIFYPGCPVPAESYAPLARAIAERGHPVHLMRLPLRCAPGGFQAQVIAATRHIMQADTGRTWAVGGHSHGGVIASGFAADYPHELQSLILIGTSHPRETDLSALDRPVTKIFGSRDGVASESKVHATAHLLPAATSWVRLEGGNHAQFGWYAFQLGDHAATITRAAQQAATLEAICRTLEAGRQTAAEKRSLSRSHAHSQTGYG